MPAQAVIEGIACTIEKLPNGSIRVQHIGNQLNAMHGPGTQGEFFYDVHPCQRNQYDVLNLELPADERGKPTGADADQRPWWSLAAGERAGFRD